MIAILSSAVARLATGAAVSPRGTAMPMDQLYLDHAATTPCDPRVAALVTAMFAAEYGNPHSSTHEFGRRAADAVDIARDQVASLLGVEAREIVFTSGATEANNLAIKGAARYRAAHGDGARRIITLTTEHKCVLESVRDLRREGFEPVILPVGPDGRVEPEVLRAALSVPTALVSIMAVNNETGVMQDLAGLAPLIRGAGALLHSDLAQAAGKIPLDLRALNVDLASVSGHKLYGPKGVGALFVRRRPRVRLQPLFSGGGQERGLRSGTLPAPLVAGFGLACAIAAQEGAAEATRVSANAEALMAALVRRDSGVVLNAAASPRYAGILSLRFPGVTALDLLATAEGLALSVGSACSSAELEPSYVLTAMGLAAAEAAESLRLSVGRFTSPADMARAAELLSHAASTLRADAQPHDRMTGIALCRT